MDNFTTLIQALSILFLVAIVGLLTGAKLMNLLSLLLGKGSMKHKDDEHRA